MKANPLPPIEVLRERYRYEADTGALYTRTSTYNKRLRQSVLCDGWRLVSTHSRSGYLVTQCMGIQIKAHRICYALHHGADPYPLQIDHINRDKSDNRICNLRAVLPAVNAKNRDDSNQWKYKPVRITYPDGRGTIICDNIKTAALILNRPYGCIQQHLRRGSTNPLQWRYNGRRSSSGITVSYAHT